MDFKNNTLTNLSYPILTSGVTNVDAPHSPEARSSMFGDLLQTTLLEASYIDPINLMSNTVSMHVVQRSFSNQLFSGFATVRAQSLLLKKDVVDLSSFLPQLDQAKIEKVKTEEQ